MNDYDYLEICNKHKAKENKFDNAVIAFLSGGFMGLISEVIIELLCNIFYISRVFSGTIMIIVFIFIGSLFTSLGFFDKLVYKFKCGLLIPITGFAHSMTSASLDYKNEGLIYGIGSNIFKMSGSVILYGIVSAWFFGMIRYIIGG